MPSQEPRDGIEPGIWAARLVILAAFFDLFMQFPVVAPYARSLGASPTLIGVIVGAYSAANLVGNLLAGAILDRWGRKTPVLGGLLLTAAALVAYIFARTPEQLLTARVVHGLTAAILTPGAFALIADTAAPDRRAQAMGVNGAFIAVAAVIGPLVAGIIRDGIGVDAVFLVSASLMLIAAIPFARLAREPMAPANLYDLPESTGADYLTLWRRRRLVAAYTTALALTIGLGTLVTHLPLALTAQGEPSSQVGLAFTVFAAVAMVVMISPLSRLSDRYGRSALVSAGLALAGSGLLVLALGGAGSVAGGMAVFGLGFGLLFPAATALVGDAARRNERGRAFGIFYAVYSLGVVIGSVLSGLTNERLEGLTGAPFFVGALVALTAALVILVISRHRADGAGEES